MALATRCPNCHALFRVVADQLKLRGGSVRCGNCQQVFDAIGTLSYIDDAVLSTAGQAVAAGVPASLTQRAAVGDSAAAAIVAPPPMVVESPEQVIDPQAEPSPTAPVDEPRPSVSVAPVSSAAAETAPGKLNVDAPAAVPSGDERAATAEHDAGVPLEKVAAPAFLRDESRPGRRSLSILLGASAVALALVALAQLAVMFRAEILAKFPESRPALTQLCKVFRCTVNWPTRGESLAVVGSDLQALPGTSAFELSAVVRNRGAVTLALPAIELTLTDTFNRTVARRIFRPTEYLSGEADAQERLLAGLTPGDDLNIRVAFEARGLNAAGFVVYPFYL